MNEKQKSILATASETFMRYGVRRTTMSEIAAAASVSRPTLYSFYGSKEDLLGGVIEFYNQMNIETITAQIENCTSLAEKLDVYFEHAVLKVFDLMQAWPDAGDIVTEDNQVAMRAYQKGLEDMAELVQDMLKPYAPTIEKHGQTTAAYAEFIVLTTSKLKKNLDSRQQLETLLGSLKASVLCVAEPS